VTSVELVYLILYINSLRLSVCLTGVLSVCLTRVLRGLGRERSVKQRATGVSL